ncbi:MULTISPECIES: TonB-dependent receptor plug domain-containing protein [Brevundimonas]|jgi:vitamin B12 transporter|uniref:TonB-dependent receptor plug domain-containing protein n=1 Tax=Brevundimonas TaxID=41275 RepID=UPI0019080172|nr:MULTISPECIES: TonB-dependent receptor [Brevundimonas]MDA0743043.1 TonB-dependent receptor [Pseudomonadota bacterium]MBK1968036.1 TonB-dependent receptor [Brevundimonas diminuta]MBK1974686.1 TonB-dependent receptor [Brevundimonas diminuta]MDA1321755.1 TonB-dependent receptor [Pseudomonadota bacterium]MDM8351358.1 TonB-dependent receptor [Brevundimonas diminuta]
MNRTAFATLAAASLLAAAPAFAVETVDQQAAAPDVAGRAGATAVEDVVVTANRSAQPIERVGASVTVLTQAAIEARQTPAVVELLAQTPGVSFTRNGGVGTSTGVNIRGAESQHTVVLIDGVKLNDPSSTQGGFNFGNLLIGDTARIEVLRGAQSTLWGSQAIGGVVNIVTAEPTEALQGSLDAEAGARGTTYFRGGIGGANERLSWRLAASRYDTDGFSAFAKGTEDDGYTNTGLSGRLNLKVTDAVSLDLRSVWSSGRNDFDAFNGDSREYGKTQELVAYAGLNFDLLDGRFRNRIGYAHTDTDRRNFNPDNKVQTLTFDAEGQNRRWEYQGAFAFTEALNATFGLEHEKSEMKTRSPGDWNPNPAFGRGEAELNSAYGQVQWTVLDGLTLTGGLRYDDHAQYGDNLLGQVAAAWALNEGDTVVRASWGQGFRAPGLYELYSEYGNLNLQPEEFDSWEIGVEQRLFDRAVVSATYFNRQADNEIRYNGCSTPSTDPLCTVNGAGRWGYYRNVQKTEAQGVELVGRVDVTERLNVSANYTWTDAKSASGATDGKRLTRRPEHMANFAADYAFAFGLKTGVAVRYVGETFNNDTNTVKVDAYTLVDLRASYPINDTLEVYGRIENAFDEDYQTVLNYGAPGRGVFGGVRVRF